MSVDDVVWDIPRGKGIRIVSFIPERIISRPNVSFWLTKAQCQGWSVLHNGPNNVRVA